MLPHILLVNHFSKVLKFLASHSKILFCPTKNTWRWARRERERIGWGISARRLWSRISRGPPRGSSRGWRTWKFSWSINWSSCALVQWCWEVLAGQDGDLLVDGLAGIVLSLGGGGQVVLVLASENWVGWDKWRCDNFVDLRQGKKGWGLGVRV